MKHSVIAPGFIHTPFNWVYATAADRVAARFDPADVLKAALDEDTGDGWVLMSVDGTGVGTWKGLGRDLPTLDRIPAPTADVSLAGHKLTLVGNATAGTDALNRVTADGRYDAAGAAAAAQAAAQAASLPVGTTLDAVPGAAADVSLHGHKLTLVGDATADTDALNRQTGDGRYGRLGAPNTFTDTQTWKNKTAVTFQGGSGSFVLNPGGTVAQIDQYGSFILGPSLALDTTSVPGQTTGDIHCITADFLFSLSDLRPHARHFMGKECANPGNFLGGRWPGVYPYTKGWTKVAAGGSVLPAVGAASFNLNLASTAGFTGSDGGHIGEAIIRDGSHIAHVQYDNYAGNVLHITNVVADNNPGVALGANTNVSDALVADTSLALFYGAAFNGIDDGFRDRSGGFYIRTRETARPDPSLDGLYYQAGSFTITTTSPGPASQRKDRLVIDETGSLALYGAGITAPANINRRVTIAAATAALRQQTTITSAGFALPAATITVRDLISTDFPAAGTVQIVSDAGTQTINYTGIDTTGGPANHRLTGCTGGTGNVAAGAAVVLVVTMPGSGGPSTLSLDDVAIFSKGPSGIVSVGANLITFTGIDTANRRLTGCTGGSGTVLAGTAVSRDITSPTIILGARGQIAASDTGAGQTVIGNVGPLGEPGLQMGPSSTATAYAKSPSNGGVASIVTDQQGFRVGTLALLSPSSTINRIRANYLPSSDRLSDTASPSWGIQLGESDRFQITRAPATAGAPAYSSLLQMDSTGKLTLFATGNGSLTTSGGVDVSGNLRIITANSIIMENAATGSGIVIQAKVAADTVDRMVIRTDGRVEYGSGAAVADVMTKRDSAGVMRICTTDSATDKDLKLGNLIASAGIQWATAGMAQTTVGAAGGASALPAAPTKYLKVIDSTGTTLVIPAYAAA